MHRRTKMITQKELKKLLKYNKDTGVFTYLIKTAFMVKVGSAAGTTTARGYRAIKLKGKSYRAHRLAFLYVTGNWPIEVDHINHITCDNRWENLREVTHLENGKNQKLSSRNKSGIVGVFWVVKDSSWYSQIKVNGNHIHLGLFKDFFEACCSRKSSENLYNFHANHGARYLEGK